MHNFIVVGDPRQVRQSSYKYRIWNK